MELELFAVLVGDFFESGFPRRLYFLVIFLKKGLLLADYPQFLEYLIVLVPGGLQLFDFRSQIADLLLI